MSDSAPKTVFELSENERREYAEAMLSRGSERIEIGRSAFRQLYPEAPLEMINAAVFHVYVDGIDAAKMWLADAERLLRDPSQTLNYGVTWELLNHVYNWHMLESLMPAGRQGIEARLDDIQLFAEEGDLNALRATIAQIKEMLNGDETAPNFR